MRQLERNTQTVYFAHQIGETDDPYSPQPIYDEPEAVKMVVAPIGGAYQLQLFGMARDYTRVLTRSGKCEIHAGDAVWIDHDLDQPNDYEATLVRQTLCETAVLVEEVRP